MLTARDLTARTRPSAPLPPSSPSVPTLLHSGRSSTLLHEPLHPPQPPQVLLLLLDINVLRHEQRERGVDPADIQVLLQQALDLLVQLLERRARVEGRGVVADELRGGLRGRGFVVWEVGDGLDGEDAGVGYEVDAEGALGRKSQFGRDGGVGTRADGDRPCSSVGSAR